MLGTSSSSSWSGSALVNKTPATHVALQELIAGPPQHLRPKRKGIELDDEASQNAAEGKRDPTLGVLEVRDGKLMRVSREAETRLQKVVVPDPHPLRRIPAHVLQEEDYAEAVSAIIERDFFPDLPHLRLRRELLKAKIHGDMAQAQLLQQKLAALPRPTPASTPAGVTPAPTPWATPQAAGADATPGPPRDASHETTAAQRLSAWEREDGAESTFGGNTDAGPPHALLRLLSGKEVAVDLACVRLDDFQRVFTSEDNASFEAILAKDMEKRRQKEWWIEGMEQYHNAEQKEHALALQDDQSLPPGILMTNVFKGRNSMSWTPQGLPQPDLEKPKVDFKNTRFTSLEQVELECSLPMAIAGRRARMTGERIEEAFHRMAQEGRFDISALGKGQLSAPQRAIGGRMQSPAPGVTIRGFGLVATPNLAPGEGGMSPLMTYGKIASTPRLLEENARGPTFVMAEESERELAADKLQRNATQRLRDTKKQSKEGRLKALGMSPASAGGRTGAPGTGHRFTPGTVSSKITPLTPISALLKQAQKMAQKGGRLRIGTESPGLSMATPAPPAKRSRNDEASGSRLPASITDNLL